MENFSGQRSSYCLKKKSSDERDWWSFPTGQHFFSGQSYGPKTASPLCKQAAATTAEAERQNTSRLLHIYFCWVLGTFYDYLSPNTYMDQPLVVQGDRSLRAHLFHRSCCWPPCPTLRSVWSLSQPLMYSRRDWKSWEESQRCIFSHPENIIKGAWSHITADFLRGLSGVLIMIMLNILLCLCLFIYSDAWWDW